MNEPASPSSSPQRVVVTYDPRRRQRRRLVFVLSVIVATLAGFWLGDAQLFMQLRDRWRLAGERDGFRSQVQSLQGDLEAERLETQVARQTVEGLRRNIRDLEEQVDGLQQEINFYQGLMAPDDRQRGLSVRSLEFIPTDNPQVYDYLLVLQQLGGPHDTIAGRSSLAIEGRVNGEASELEWVALAPGKDMAGMPYRFRYFQKLEGRVTLPAGFLPESVLVSVRPGGNNGRSVEQKFPWRLREGN